MKLYQILNRNLPVLGLISGIAAATSLAHADCSDDLPLDQLLPGTTVELKVPLKVDYYSHTSFDDISLYFINGKYHVSSGTFTAGLQGVQRHVAMTFEKPPNVTREDWYRKKSTAPFKCVLEKAVSGADAIPDVEPTNDRKAEVFLDFKSPCPMHLTMYRAFHDPRSKQMSLGSLKHNLGERFTITAKCKESEKPSSKISENRVKPQTGAGPTGAVPSTRPAPGKVSTSVK